MKTSLKVILTAVSIATLASPVMAQSLITRPYVGEWAANSSNADGAVAGARGAGGGERAWVRGSHPHEKGGSRH